ncbi:MAG: DUF4126 domain-containing protein [Solibacillus sp.]
MDYILAIFVGIGLSISAGFRLFTPLFVLSLTTKLGWLELGAGFEWLSSTPTLIGFGVAVVIELVCNYIPVVDNFMKMIAAPFVLMAGTLLTVSVIGVDDSPFLSWALALIAGGGTATSAQLTSTAVRGTSTVTTAGIANPVVAIIEEIGAWMMSIVSIIFPVVAVILVIVFVVIFVKMFSTIRARFS